MSLLKVNTIRNKVGTGSPSFDRGIVVTGNSDLGNVRISSGIVTANTGIVTYYGDASKLSNIGIGVTYIPNNITVLGTSTFTNLRTTNFNSTGISTITTLRSANINATGIITSSTFDGSGVNLTGIVTSIIAGANVSISTSFGSVIIDAGLEQIPEYWESTSVGINTLSKVGIGTTNPTSQFTVVGNALISGITSSTGGFSGNLTGNVVGNSDTATNSTNSSNVAITNDLASASANYITFVSNTSGNRPVKVSSTKLTFNPSVNILSVGNVEVSQTITASTIISTAEIISNGNITVVGDIILTSPNLTQYKLVVDDLGNLSTVAI